MARASHLLTVSAREAVQLGLADCSGLASLPDLSGLPQLEVYGLPIHLQPWAAGGYQAWTHPTAAQASTSASTSTVSTVTVATFTSQFNSYSEKSGKIFRLRNKIKTNIVI